MASKHRRVVLAMVPSALLLLLIVLAEITLRAVSPSPENELTLPVTYDGIEWNQINRGFLRRYFPANAPLIPEFKPTMFKRVKTPGLIRIMCLGESSMFGTPYEMTATIPGIVRKQLRHRHPGVEFEVVNWGASAINSNVIRDLASRLPAYAPDAVIIYMGHNEFYGPDGIGASWPERQLPALTPLKYDMRGLRIVQLLQSALRSFFTAAPEADRMNLMRQVSQGNMVRVASPEAERVFTIFERNFAAILKLLGEQGIPVVVSDVTSNLMFPPFASDSVTEISPADRNWIETHPRGNGREELLRHMEESSARESTNAWLNYWYGRRLLAEGDTARGKELLIRARDNDLLTFRAPSRINAIIRRVSSAASVRCVSADSAFAAVSPGGIAGDSLFWEHLHPTLHGYYLIAHEFVKAVEGVLPAVASLNSSERSFLPLDSDSLSICWLDLAYADRSIMHLTGRWPFAGYARAPVVLASGDSVLRTIVERTYARENSWDDGVYKSAAYFWGKGEYREALTTYEALVEEYPYGFYAQYLAGSLLNTMGRPEEALEHYAVSVRSNPRYAKSRLDLGLLQVNAGRFDAAMATLDTALRLAQVDRLVEVEMIARYGLAAALANRGERKEALEELANALRLNPRYRDALILRERILAQGAN